jgi:3-hydroxyacyl-[acyl-carrier-protein] dehydratase
MLKDELYTVAALQHIDGRISATLEINQQHEIFKGHFPGQPVLPGACMLQMVKEVLEGAIGRALRLKKADNLKFLSVVDPGVNEILVLSLSYTLVEDVLNITASLKAGDVVCLKMKGVFCLGGTYGAN